MKDVYLADGERLDEVNEHITLIQKKDGLTFGTDAFLLASFIRPAPRARAAELGSGTGIISLLLAARERLGEIWALEIQEEFAELSRRNAELNALDSKVKVLHTDVTKALPSHVGGELDVVFSNPPYMRTDSGKRNDNDMKYIARHEVCGDINDFCAAAFRLLKHGGRFYVVWRPDRLTDLMFALRSHRLEPKVMTMVHADGDSIPSMVLISATKGGASGMRVTPPLMLHDGKDHSKMSAMAEQIYESMSFDCLKG